MKLFFLGCCFAATTGAFAQNVGIGTTTPQTPLHVLVNNAVATLRVETGLTTGSSVLELRSSSTDLDELKLTKYATSATGTIGGLSASGLSAITTGTNAQGGLLIGTSGNYPLSLSTNGFVKMQIRSDGNTGVAVEPNNFSRFHVRRIVNYVLTIPVYTGTIFAENGSDIDGSGVYGVTLSSKNNFNYAGITGTNISTGTEKFGVIGTSSGTSGGTVYSAGVGGYGDYGVLGSSASNTGAGVIAQHSGGRVALELNNGFMKVSGAEGNRSAFKHTVSEANTIGNSSTLGYANQSSTDIIIITQDAGTDINCFDKKVGVRWNGTNWAIITQDQVSIPPGLIFNVLVIKQ